MLQVINVMKMMESGNRAFVEIDRLGGFDPYSASKACAEIVATSYQKSFFRTNTQKLASSKSR